MSAPGSGSLLAIQGLSVSYRQGRASNIAVEYVSFEVAPGETVALVGASGSGKSTTAHSIIRLLPSNARIESGRVAFAGEDLTRLGRRGLRGIRGRRIGLVPQDPAVSLNPVQRVGRQVAEVLLLHGLADRRSAPIRAIEALEAAGLDHPGARARQYPHELSGGMRQRALIAIALAPKPSLVIADEATSALDVTVQRQILDHLALMTRELGTAILMITHDLGVAADRADRLLVMNQGRLVEEGRPAQLLAAPRDAYTQALIAAAPSLAASTRRDIVTDAVRPAVRSRASRPSDGAEPEDLLVAKHLVKEYVLPDPGGRKEILRAVDDLSLTVARGQTVGLVGESGSGKSTTARLLLRLTDATSGSVHLDGRDISDVDGEPLRQLRRKLQIVFQNPYTSLNPRMRVVDIVAEPLRSFGVASKAEGRQRAATWLDRVGLPRSAEERRPAELSGGQRQRVAIARALVLDPELVVLDEPVSALDVLVQGQILTQLAQLQREFGVSYLFISHDLAVVREIAHMVAVMKQGRIIEEGPVERVLDRPSHGYTKELVDAIPGATELHRLRASQAAD